MRAKSTSIMTCSAQSVENLAEAVTAEKVRRLRRLASLWLAEQQTRWAAIRIDVVGVRVGRRRTPEISHLKGIG